MPNAFRLHGSLVEQDRDFGSGIGRLLVLKVDWFGGPPFFSGHSASLCLHVDLRGRPSSAQRWEGKMVAYLVDVGSDVRAGDSLLRSQVEGRTSGGLGWLPD